MTSDLSDESEDDFDINCVFDLRNRLGAATKHLLQFAIASRLLDLASWKSS